MVISRMKIRWSRRALDDQDEGLAYIAHFNPEAAHRLRLSIEEGLEHIRAFPNASRAVPEAGNPCIREVLREPFRVMYQVCPRELRILAVRSMERAAMDERDF